MFRYRTLVVLAVSVLSSPLLAETIRETRVVPMSAADAALITADRAEVLSDRFAYWNDDRQAQLVALFGLTAAKDGARVKLDVDSDSKTIDLAQAKEPSPIRVAFLVDLDALKPGKHTIKAAVLGADGKTITESKLFDLIREDKSHPKIPFPADGIKLNVQPIEGESHDVAWPITTGVPMPFGTVDDVAKLQLLENGKPVAAQWSTRATWTPATPTFVKWAWLDFVARYDQGKPREYRIVSRKAGELSGNAIKIDETPDRFTIDTGAIRFDVDRKHFNGITSASIGNATVVQTPAPPPKDEKTAIVEAPTGPYLTDGRSILYRAADDPNVKVDIEERGPVRVTIVARGWYTNPKVSDEAGKQLCQFITRISAHAGSPTIDVSQRTVITYDTRLDKLADVAFAVPVASSTRWVTGIDGKPIDGAVPALGSSMWIHQDRSDHVRLVEGTTNAKSKAEGQHADGWMAVAGDKGAGGVVGNLRDVWQKFPKELEVDRNGLKFHLWPRHGRRSFSEEEELDRHGIYKALFAHQGALLDLQMPSDYYDRLVEWNAKLTWDYEDTAIRGYMSTGEGLAIGNDFAITLVAGDVDATRAAQDARLFQQNPHALTDGAWNVATLVEGRLSARDDARNPDVEKMLNVAYPVSMHGLVDEAREYGMWIYANTHNNWELPINAPQLHRVWNNSHYRHVWTPWILYLRGASPDMLSWAREQTDNWMDVCTVNYASFQASGRPNFKGHMPGAMYHVKGFVPWGSRQYGMPAYDTDVGTSGHWVNPDAFRIRYYIEGTARAWDLYQLWADSYSKAPMTIAPGREGINTMGELLAYYAATWDPRAIGWLRDGAERLLAMPFKDYPYGWSNWHKQWIERYYDLTRDPRIIKSVADNIAAGNDDATQNAFAFYTTGDKQCLIRLMPGVWDTAHKAYYNPDDPAFNGFGPHTSAINQYALQQYPSYLQALKDADLSLLPDGDKPPRGLYPVGGSHLFRETERREISMTILALDPDDRAFNLRLETLDGHDMHPADIIVIAPSGKVVKTIELHPVETKKLRYVGNEAYVATIPKDGESGVYRIELLGTSPFFFTPITDLPHEIAMWQKDKPMNGIGRQQGFIALPANTEATLTFEGISVYDHASASYVCVGGSPDVKPLLESSVLAGSKRPTVSVTLKSAATMQTWPICLVAEYGPSTRWTGAAEAVYFSPRSTDFEPILKALANSPAPNAPK